MPVDTEELLDNLIQYGWEYYGVYLGLHRGIVTDNADPENRGRIQARVPTCQERAPDIWIKAAAMGAGPNRGTFWPPERGDAVYISFAQGMPDRPELYIGGWFAYPDNESDAPQEARPDGAPDVRAITTRMGHVLLFDDAGGNERVELTWNKPNTGDEASTDRTKTATRPGSNTSGGGSASIKFTPEGSIEVTDNANPNQTIKMDADAGTIEIADKSGNKVVLSSTGVRIEATAIDLGGDATEPGVKGNAWLRYELAHTHTTPVGPSGPPITPPTPSILSQTVKLK